MNRCKCLKGNNKQCLRQAKTDSKFCWQHQTCQKMVNRGQKLGQSSQKKNQSKQKNDQRDADAIRNISQNGKKAQDSNTTAKIQNKVIDPEIKKAYQEFKKEYKFDQPLSLKDFETIYNTVKKDWFENMGEYLNIEDYDFDEQQKQQINAELALNFPDKYNPIE